MTNATNNNAVQWEDGTLGMDPNTAVAVSPELDKRVNNTLGLVDVTIHIDKETFQRLEAKAKEKGIITKALIRNTLVGSVEPTPTITRFGTVKLDEQGEICLLGFNMDFKGLDIRRDVGCVYALIAYLQNEIDKHLLKYPEADTVESLPDGTVLNSNENMLDRIKKQYDIITLGELLEQKRNEARS